MTLRLNTCLGVFMMNVGEQTLVLLQNAQPLQSTVTAADCRQGLAANSDNSTAAMQNYLAKLSAMHGV